MLRVRSLALGALMVVGVAAVAEAQASSTPRSYPEGGIRERGEMGRRGGPGRKAGPRRGGFGLGRDLNLTEAQRTQIAAIHQKYQPQRRALHEQTRPFLDAARTARQNWDSTAFRTNSERARQIMSGDEAIRTRELAEIRNVLTAEQRTKFDARQKERAERRAKMKAEGGRRGWSKQPRQPGQPGVRDS
jgi:Spy/CpxP family protein refolding chaperone